MISSRQLFLKYVAQTSDSPILLEIVKAEGVYLFDNSGKKYIDLISGVSVSNIGHGNPKVIEAIKNQADNFMHLMVYGEYVLSPQVTLANLLISNLPPELDNVYYVNSGSEAIEGAIKLAKRFTGRSEIISFRNAYHGSTNGALSLMGNESFKNSFRPLLPGVKFLEFNNFDDVEKITKKTACVVIEPIQGEAGIIVPDNKFLVMLRERCSKTGTLLIFDEIQTGFGRTGSLFAFQKFKVIPDILTVAKSFGGGMPLGAFISSERIMRSLKSDPVLGHITTFGGHPVCCAAAIASLEFLLESRLIEHVERKGKIFLERLKHSKIKEIRGTGLFFAVELENREELHKTIKNALGYGLVTDWFLFNENSFRISPPLTITDEQIEKSCEILLRSIDD